MRSAKGRIILLSLECEKLYAEESDRHAEGCCNQVACHRRKAEPVVENDYDDVLDDVVRDIRYGEADEPVPRQRFREHEGAVQPVGDDIGRDVTEVEGEVRVPHGETVEPRKDGAVQRIDAADDEEQQKFPREKMAAKLSQGKHPKTPFLHTLSLTRLRLSILAENLRQQKKKTS